MTTLVQALNGQFITRLDSTVPFRFDAECFQTADSLTPEQWTQYGLTPLVHTTIPTYDQLTQTAVESTTLVNGVWTQTWTIRPLEIHILRATSIAAAEAILSNVLNAGVVYNGQTYPCDSFAQAKIHALVTAYSTGLLAASATVPIRNLANNVTTMFTSAQVTALASVMLAAVMAAEQTYWATIDALPVA